MGYVFKCGPKEYSFFRRFGHKTGIRLLAISGFLSGMIFAQIGYVFLESLGKGSSLLEYRVSNFWLGHKKG